MASSRTSITPALSLARSSPAHSPLRTAAMPLRILMARLVNGRDARERLSFGAGWLKAGNERRLRAVGCETIYAFIYRAAQKAEQLWRYLTRHPNAAACADRGLRAIP